MKRPAVLAALLCSLGWIFISGSDSEAVEVREVEEGENVTLVCPSITTEPATAEWFRVVNRTKPSCIASLYFPDTEATNCPGFESGKFKMTANTSAVFLHIAHADSSDSGLYFCSFYIKKHTTISTATLLNVARFQDGEKNNNSNQKCNNEQVQGQISIVLGGLCVLLTMITIALVFKVQKLKTAANKVVQQETHKDQEENYAALTILAKPKKNPRHARKREPEPMVIYSTTR